MTVIREENVITTGINEESLDYAEMFDISRLFIPAELYIPEDYFEK